MRDYHRELSRATLTVGPFLNTVFNSINIAGIELITGVSDTCPTMIVSSHRSHLDYLIMGVILNKAGIKNVRMAAGDNLTNMPYIGKKLVSYGAFSVYRALSRNKNYVINLCRTVVEMLENEDNVLVFPEGGRSYSGKMGEIKNGIITASLVAQYNNPDKNYTFTPATISYERVPEQPYFDILMRGRNIRNKKLDFFTNSIGSLFYYGADLYATAKVISAPWFHTKFGDMYIDFGKPVLINEVVDVRKNYISDARNVFGAHKTSIHLISTLVKEKLLQLYRILPLHIVSLILKGKKSCTMNELISRVADTTAELQKQNRNIKSCNSLSEKEIAENGVEKLILFKTIKKSGNSLKINKIKIIDYYAATIG